MLLNNNNNNWSLFIVPYLSVAVRCWCQKTNWWAQITQQYPYTYVPQEQTSIYGVMQEWSINTSRLFNCSVLNKHNCYQVQGENFCSFNNILAHQCIEVFIKRTEVNLSKPKMHILFIQCIGLCMLTIILGKGLWDTESHSWKEHHTLFFKERKEGHSL